MPPPQEFIPYTKALFTYRKMDHEWWFSLSLSQKEAEYLIKLAGEEL
jgi:hypothetical protein